MEQIKDELDRLLVQLSSILHNIETQLSKEERENCFNLFPISTWTVLPRLLKILHSDTSHNIIQSFQGHSGYTSQPRNGGCLTISQNDPLQKEHGRCSSAPPETSDHNQKEYTCSDSTRKERPSYLSSISHTISEPCSEYPDTCSTERDEHLSSASPQDSTQQRDREEDVEEDVRETQKEKEFILEPWIQELWQSYSRDPNAFEIGTFQTNYHDPLIHAFNVLGNKDSTEPIYRRFQLLNFYRMAVDLDYHTGDRWCRGASTDLVRKIIGKGLSGKKDEKSLKIEIEDYCYQGMVCEKLVKKCGGLGYLLVLPRNAIENA